MLAEVRATKSVVTAATAALAAQLEEQGGGGSRAAEGCGVMEQHSGGVRSRDLILSLQCSEGSWLAAGVLCTPTGQVQAGFVFTYLSLEIRAEKASG